MEIEKFRRSTREIIADAMKIIRKRNREIGRDSEIYGEIGI